MTAERSAVTIDEIPSYCDMLIDEGMLTKEQVHDGIMVQLERGGHLLETLIDLGHLDPGEFDTVITRQTNVAVLDLHQCKIQDVTVAILPEWLASKHHVFPIDNLGPLLTLGMSIPTDTKAIEEVEGTTGLRVKPVYCPPSDIHAMIREHYFHETAEHTASA